MPTFPVRRSEERSALETVTLRSTSNANGEATPTEVWLAPSRGAIATRFVVGERDVFYLELDTLTDPAKNVRGGNPVLFPSPGPLKDGRFSRSGREGAMKQHGLARQRPWTQMEESESTVILELSSDETTRPEFPWDFRLTFRFHLEGASLRIEQKVENLSDRALPFAMGFHPYFLVPAAEKAKTRIPTTATRAWDNVKKQSVALQTIALDGGEVDLHLEDHGRNEASLELADGSRVVVTGSEEFGHWVIWTLPGKDFVCLEPWTAPFDALNTGERLLWVESRQTRALTTTITFVPA